MKYKIYFHLAMITPPIEFETMPSEDYALAQTKLFCLKELKMPVEMIKAIHIEKIEKE